MKHVAHYCHGGEETIDKIKRELSMDEYRGFCKGNMIKYRDRAPYKGNYDGDMEKHDDYLRYLIEDYAERSLPANASGFRYPPMAAQSSLLGQWIKVQEEVDETEEAARNWIESGDHVDMMDVLIEAEDAIHALEEFQRIVMEKSHMEESSLDALKCSVIDLVYYKNDERGYYGGDHD